MTDDARERVETMSHKMLEERNRAQIVLWLAQAAQVAASTDSEVEVKAIHQKLRDVLDMDFGRPHEG